MKEVFGDAMKLAKDYDIMCVTTNGDVKANGECVMGRGIALEIAKSFPYAPKLLGDKIQKLGNHVNHIFTSKSGVDVISFPVKHHWNEMADIELIKRSCLELMDYIATETKRVLLPRPGCGNGRLLWNEVKEVIAPILDDRVFIVHWEQPVVPNKPMLNKCPICELNYKLESEECCKVCNPRNKSQLATVAMEFDEERREARMKERQAHKERMEEFYSIRYNRKRRF